MKQVSKVNFSNNTNIKPSIPIYIINLKKRQERKAHVINQFRGRKEFNLKIVEAFEHSFGALGLWVTIRYILQDLVSNDEDFVIIGEDDIEFTEHYSPKRLLNAIKQAKDREADVLLGGVSWFDEAVQITDDIFWVNKFSGLHFTIIYKKFFPTLLNSILTNYDAADYKIGLMSNNVLFMYPFIAMQKEFDYSDTTSRNNEKGHVISLFKSSIHRLGIIGAVKNIFRDIPNVNEVEPLNMPYNNLMPISTYVINLPQRNDRLKHIRAQFKNKPEFNIKIVEASKHEVGSLGLWLSIRKVINMAIENNDEVIVICEDDHLFTENYSKEYLFKNIYKANEEGASYLSGGTGKFNNAVPITKNRFWIRHCLSTQFIVVFRDFFQRILDEPYDENIIVDITYSRMAINKMLLYPFISTQKDFGYSDVTTIHTEFKGFVDNMFIQSSQKLEQIQKAYTKYKFLESRTN